MKKEWILIALLSAGIAFGYHEKSKARPVAVSPVPGFPPTEEPPAGVEPPVKPKPKPQALAITPYRAVRKVDGLGRVLSDIDSHMPAGHQYRDANRITWAHETTHGINADIRNKHYMATGERVNAFYLLEDRAAVVVEPKTTIARVDANVPQSFRGTCHDLYLVRQRKGWNNEPLYLCDEWVAYTNGAACGKDLRLDADSEVEFMTEFTGYVLCLACTVKEDCPDYDDRQFRAFVMWSVERSMKLFAGEAGANRRLEAMRGSPDGEAIRRFSRRYFGVEWCSGVLGF